MSHASESYYVSDQPLGEIWRLQDLNGDGDALDAGEKLLWADSLISVVELEFHGGSLYAVEEGMIDGANQVVRFTDLNGDGDALDVGESSIWADGFDDPRGIAVDAQKVWYVTENDDDLLWALRDLNGDGDALDVGERARFADGILGATTVALVDDAILVTGSDQDTVVRLTDANSDGDALDSGESNVITPIVDSPVGLLDDGSGGFFFSSLSDDAVYHAVDRNGDGDMLDVVETLSYADSVFGGVNGPWGMANHEDGGFLLADFIDGQVLWVHDANGDGDALDQGDVRLFADGFQFPIDIAVAEISLAGDYNRDNSVDADDYVVWRNSVGAPAGTLPNDIDGGIIGYAQYDTWKANFGNTSAGASRSFVTLPEPTSRCLLIIASLVAWGSRPPGISVAFVSRAKVS